jgi:hypothetical protein
MNATLCRFYVAFVPRIVLGLALALTLLAGVTGSPTAVRADPVPRREPKYRIQVVVKAVEIYDDRDLFGSGDFSMRAILHRCPDPPVDDCASILFEGLSSEHMARFSGDTGDIVKLYLTLPNAADPVWGGYDLSEDAGYPMYDGERYVLRFDLWDLDPGVNDNDYMGFVDVPLAEENQYYLGTHHVVATRGGFGDSGDFGLEYEVRITPLPNLQPFSIERFAVPNSTDDFVCIGVANNGVALSGPFQVTLRTDGFIPRDGVIDVGGFAPGQVNTVCTTTNLPTIGPNHSWAAIVDEAGSVPETYERDNRLDGQIPPRPGGTPPGPGATPAAPASPAPSSTSTPTPSATVPDLTVSAIKVNGRVPDGKDDCKDGKNAVTVVVKNGGTTDAGGFAVRLVVDDAQGAAVEQSVSGLEAGQEREVRFDDVRLKKGEHKLTATVDPKSSITELKEDNNSRTVSATCKDAA